MLARSMAWRHGVGRTCEKPTSMTATSTPLVMRLAGFTSRWARPASHIRRTMPMASSMRAMSMSASPISW